MPAYNTTAQGQGIVSCRANSPQTVWNAETIAVNGKSLQVALQQNKDTNTAAFYVYFVFAADPGASPTIAVQVADFDTDTAYVTVANGLITVSATEVAAGVFAGRFDANIIIAAKFARLKITVLANAVAVTARIGQ